MRKNLVSVSALVICAFALLTLGCHGGAIHRVPRGVENIHLTNVERTTLAVYQQGTGDPQKLDLTSKRVGTAYNARPGVYTLELHPRVFEVCLACGDEWKTASPDKWQPLPFMAIDTHKHADAIRAVPSIIFASEGLCDNPSKYARKTAKNPRVCEYAIPYTYQEGQLFYTGTFYVVITPVKGTEVTPFGTYDWYLSLGDLYDPRSQQIKGESEYRHVMRMKLARRGY